MLEEEERSAGAGGKRCGEAMEFRVNRRDDGPRSPGLLCPSSNTPIFVHIPSLFAKTK